MQQWVDVNTSDDDRRPHTMAARVAYCLSCGVQHKDHAPPRRHEDDAIMDTIRNTLIRPIGHFLCFIRNVFRNGRHDHANEPMKRENTFVVFCMDGFMQHIHPILDFYFFPIHYS